MRGKGRPACIVERYQAAMRRLVGEPPWRVLVALSGGADSTALLAAAVMASDAAQGDGMSPASSPPIAACFVDHGVRGEEDAAAAAFCHEACARLGARFIYVAIDVTDAGQGWEGAARAARYAALEDARREAGADWILVGHTADDVAETVLWRLGRGAAARGLGGIPPRTGRVVRPLIELRRAALREWLPGVEALEGLAPVGAAGPWLEDSTNTDTRFLRNRIRAEVLAPLESALPQAVESIALAAGLMREDDEYLDAAAREHLAAARIAPPEFELAVKRGLKLGPGATAYSATRLRTLPAPLARRAVRAALVAAGVSPEDITSRHIVLVTENLGRQGFALDLPGGFSARVRRSFLLVSNASGGPSRA